MNDDNRHDGRPWLSGGEFRPDPALKTYFIVLSILTLPGVFVALPMLMARYHTLRYRLDDHGVSMKVGLLFRKESNLTYRRIQDVHVTRGLLQRWFGLSSVAVQTASGSSTAEVTLEGVRDADALRDFLYERMRGARDDDGGAETGGARASAPADEAMALLREIRDSLAAASARGGGAGRGEGSGGGGGGGA